MPYTTDSAALLARFDTRLRRAGIVVPTEFKAVAVAFAEEHAKDQRERLADVIDSLSGLYDTLDTEQIDTLARLVRRHHVDAEGNLCPQDD